MLFLLLHFLNAGHGVLTWLLENSCPRPVILPLSQFHAFQSLSSTFPAQSLPKPNFNNSLTLSSLCPYSLPMPSSLPSFSGLDRTGTIISWTLSPTLLQNPWCPVVLANSGLTSHLHPCRQTKITMVTFLSWNSQSQSLRTLSNLQKSCDSTLVHPHPTFLVIDFTPEYKAKKNYRQKIWHWKLDLPTLWTAIYIQLAVP